MTAGGTPAQGDIYGPIVSDANELISAAQYLSDCHKRDAQLLQQWSRGFNAAAALLAALAGGSGLGQSLGTGATLDVPAKGAKLVQIPVTHTPWAYFAPTVALLAAILAGILSVYKWSERAAQHRDLSADYFEVALGLQLLLTKIRLDPAMSITVALDQLSQSEQRMVVLAKTGPIEDHPPIAAGQKVAVSTEKVA